MKLIQHCHVEPSLTFSDADTVQVALGREAQERAASRSGSRSRSSTAGCEADELDGSQGDASDVVGEERTVLASPILTTLPAHIDLGDGTEIAMSDVRNWQLDVPSYVPSGGPQWIALLHVVCQKKPLLDLN